MLQTFRSGSKGRVWKEEWIFLSPLHLALNVSSGFPHPSCLCLRHISHLCPSSLKLYCSSPRGDYCSLQQVSPVDTHPIPENYPFCPLWILNSGIISVGVVAAMVPSNSSLHPTWEKVQTFLQQLQRSRNSLLSLS